MAPAPRGCRSSDVDRPQNAELVRQASICVKPDGIINRFPVVINSLYNQHGKINKHIVQQNGSKSGVGNTIDKAP